MPREATHDYRFVFYTAVVVSQFVGLAQSRRRKSSDEE